MRSLLSCRRLVLALVLLGLVLRSYHYLRDRNVWHDEAAIAVNILDRGFLDLLGPLDLTQAAPPLFLWLAHADSLLFGDSSLALRLPSFLAGCASFLLLTWVALSRLEPRAAPWAVLLFGCSETLLWHTCELKPYIFDVLAATLVLAVWCATEAGTLRRRLLAFTLLAPPLVFLSYPACFLYGGLLAALLPGVRRERSCWPWYGLLCAVAGGCFLVLLRGPVRWQHSDEIHRCWTSCMADWRRPWKVPLWGLASTFEVFRYVCKPLGQLLAVLAVLGGVLLWRRGERAWVVLLSLPVGLALVAALVQRYPYGGVRVMAYTAPALVLLIAAGTAPALAWLGRRFRPGVVGLAGLLVVPLGVAVQQAVVVWKEADVRGASAYVLASCRAGDTILGSDWTHLYYFRGCPAFLGNELGRSQPGKRLWVVVTTSNRSLEFRHWVAPQMAPPDWQAIECREFAETSVFLYVAPDRLLARPTAMATLPRPRTG
jgi:hypothetical protein